jgi:hypothetical protein
VEGTPAAVLVDQEGRVATDVAVGGADVLALVRTRVSGNDRFNRRMQAAP